MDSAVCPLELRFLQHWVLAVGVLPAPLSVGFDVCSLYECFCPLGFFLFSVGALFLSVEIRGMSVEFPVCIALGFGYGRWSTPGICPLEFGINSMYKCFCPLGYFFCPLDSAVCPLFFLFCIAGFLFMAVGFPRRVCPLDLAFIPYISVLSVGFLFSP